MSCWLCAADAAGQDDNATTIVRLHYPPTFVHEAHEFLFFFLSSIILSCLSLELVNVVHATLLLCFFFFNQALRNSYLYFVVT